MTPFATATPTDGSQPAPPLARCHGCTVVAATTAIIRTRHTRALRQTRALSLSMPAVTSRFQPTVPIHPLLPPPSPRPKPPTSTGNTTLNSKLPETYIQLLFFLRFVTAHRAYLKYVYCYYYHRLELQVWYTREINVN